MAKTIVFPEPRISEVLFSDTRVSWFWLIARVYVGYEWFMAGWDKLGNAAWTGSQAGTAIQGFLKGALAKTVGEHPSVPSWYAFFVENIASHHTVFLSYAVTYGEIAVGLGLILGAFTGIAAFFGAFMNFNYLFAGTVSINPTLLVIQLFLILAWRNAGWLGLDRWLLPAIGVPWSRK